MQPASGAEPFTLQLAKFSFRFRLPKCRNVNFEGCFASSVAAEDTLALMANLNSSRSALASALSTASPDPSAVVGLCDQYLPNIFRLFDSLNHTTGSVGLDQRLVFEWTSGLLLFDSTFSQYEEIIFDIGMTLVTKMLAHANRAHDMCVGASADFAAAAVELRAAAGVAQFLSQRLLPRWNSSSSAVASRPSDVSEPVLACLGHFFLAQAQQFAVCKAMTQATPPGLMCELCRGVTEMHETSLHVLHNEASAHVARIVPTFAIHVQVMRELYVGLTCRYMAEALALNREVGAAMGYIDKATNKHLVNKENFSSSGLPLFTKGQFESLATPLTNLKLRLRQLRETFDRDNRLIYFETVLEEDQLPDLKPSRILMRATAYSEPQQPDVEFITAEMKAAQAEAKRQAELAEAQRRAAEAAALKAARDAEREAQRQAKGPGLFGSLFGMGASSRTVAAPPTPNPNPTPNPSATSQDSRPRSDSDLARELQAKINAGQDL